MARNTSMARSSWSACTRILVIRTSGTTGSRDGDGGIEAVELAGVPAEDGLGQVGWHRGQPFVELLGGRWFVVEDVEMGEVGRPHQPVGRRHGRHGGEAALVGITGDPD